MAYKSIELEINKLLMLMLQRNASDLHLTSGKPPTFRIDSQLIEMKDYEVLSGNSIARTSSPQITALAIMWVLLRARIL